MPPKTALPQVTDKSSQNTRYVVELAINIAKTSNSKWDYMSSPSEIKIAHWESRRKSGRERKSRDT